MEMFNEMKGKLSWFEIVMRIIRILFIIFIIYLIL